MRILGIDPGIATVGFSILNYQNNRFVLERCGVITTPAHTSLASRLNRIYEDTGELLRLFTPDAVSVEELFFNTNITTGIAVAHGRGAILLACERAGIPIFEYTPMQVKQAVTGYGKAEKRQVMDMVKRICGLKDVPKPDDAADAVALAICHARSSGSLLANRGDQNTCSTI
ncbi:MAG: crossover junction endodeoxyribonuclease RuvC [Candidatus Limivicinus sp.]|jgi:crossover junction endodeoxyribonuclease RuvC